MDALQHENCSTWVSEDYAAIDAFLRRLRYELGEVPATTNIEAMVRRARHAHLD